MSATQMQWMSSANLARTRLPVIELVLSAAILVFAILSLALLRSPRALLVSSGGHSR